MSRHKLMGKGRFDRQRHDRQHHEAGGGSEMPDWELREQVGGDWDVKTSDIVFDLQAGMLKGRSFEEARRRCLSEEGVPAAFRGCCFSR